MLAMLGDFFFTTNDIGYQRVYEHFTFSYAEHPKAQGATHYEPVGEVEHHIELEGDIVLKPDNSLDAIKSMGEAKKPVLLVFGTGYAFWVKIQHLEIDSTRFIPSGSALKREFKVRLTRVYHGNDIQG